MRVSACAWALAPALLCWDVDISMLELKYRWPDRYHSLYSRDDASASHPRNSLDFGSTVKKRRPRKQIRTIRRTAGGTPSVISLALKHRRNVSSNKQRWSDRVDHSQRWQPNSNRLLPELFSKLAKVTSFRNGSCGS